MFSFLPACIKNVEKWCWSGKVGDTQIRPGNGQKRGMQQQTGIVIMPVWPCITLSSVQFSRWVMSDSLWPHELEHTRPPCPSPTPGVHLNSRPSSRWCHPAISSSVVPFSSCPQSLPASESFPMSQLFTWGGQSTGAPPYSACFLISPTVVAPKVPYSGIHFTPFDFIWVHLYPHQNLGYNHGSNWNSSL